jgi:hypothetical protein
MTFRTFLLFSTLILWTKSIGQTRTLTGKVIDDKFSPIYQVRIFNVDTILLTTSEINGNFILTVPFNTKSLMIGAIGMERKIINISDTCSNLDIVLLSSGSYDFMTPGKVDRERKKYFNKLPALHKSAFEKGIFKSDKPCYIDQFITNKKELKEIKKSRTKKPST